MPKEWRATKAVKQIARVLRKQMTPAERRLWWGLRRKNVNGMHFRRQHPIGHYVADFCCTECKLIVEVDGEIHKYQGEQDYIRQTWLEAAGYNVVRFKNDDVMKNLDGVLDTTRRAGLGEKDLY